MGAWIRWSGAIAMAGLAAAAVAQVKIDPELAKEVAAMRDSYNKMPDTSGTGPYAAIKEIPATLPDHVLYRPSDLAPFGPKKKLGILVWGNGGCSADGASARLHLEEIASHGYIAVAPGGIYSGPGASTAPPHPTSTVPGGPPPVSTTYKDVLAGLDWALAENVRKGSPLYGKLDPNEVAVAGHSCGGLQALQVAGDPRIKTVIINNSGIFADGSQPITGIHVEKSLLKTLHTPIIYILGGPRDVAYPNGMDDFAKIDTVPVMVANLPVGHLATFAKPNGGVVASVSVDWLDWQLKGDARAAKRFTGAKCGLCTDPAWSVQRKGID
ncbi:MAG TPA: hypothetical protein VF409_03825 [Sphingomonas sp.]